MPDDAAPISRSNESPPGDFVLLPDYKIRFTEALSSIHTHLKPRRYFEIGTLSGSSLVLAGCHSLAVDPKFRVERNVVGNKPACSMFQMGSDDFFARFDPKAILGGKIDLAFLDGMHWFEFLLRDFINTEKHCARNSLVLMHDCLPTDTHIARRNMDDMTLGRFSRQPSWWAGDVWKAVAILLNYRPDLVIYGAAFAPTGLVAITNLDPGSTVLEDAYFQILDEYRDLGAADMRRLYGALQMMDCEDFMSHDRLSKRFWF